MRNLKQGRPILKSETGTGTSQSWTVDGVDPVLVTGVYVDYTTDATVGDRQLVFQVLDDTAAVIYESRVGVVQAASASNYIYQLGPGLSDMTTRRDTNFATTPIVSGLEVRKDWVLKVSDNNSVSSSDTLDVYFYLIR